MPRALAEPHMHRARKAHIFEADRLDDHPGVVEEAIKCILGFSVTQPAHSA